MSGATRRRRVSAHTRRTLLVAAAGAVAIAGVLALRNAVVPSPLDKLHTEARGPIIVRDGSWWFPRGGPYDLGFLSPRGRATLSINGRIVARGAGKVEVRRVYPAGAVGVKFAAPPGARLLWHPPGRRGPLEYVPPSSLVSEPPARAHFGRFVGASPLDGVASALILLLIIAVIAFAARRALAAVDRRTWAWIGIIFAFALAVRLVDLGGAGQTWDEDVNWSAGRNYITNVLSLDFRQSSWQWNYQHPPVTKYIDGIGAQLSDGYGPARALSALMVALGCALLVPIGERLRCRRAGIFAAAVAALTPHLIAHSKVVGHEAPTVLEWAAAIALCLRAHDGDDPARDPWLLPRRMAVIGVALGLAMFSRFVNGLMAPLIGLVLLIGAPPGRRKRTVVLGLAIIPLVAIATGVAIWPWLWSHPMTHLAESWAKLRQLHAPEPFLGRITNTPPRLAYFPVYLMATAPLGELVAFIAWAGSALRRRDKSALILSLWLVIPLLALFSPVRQDGVRYIMPSVLALAMAAGIGCEVVASFIAARRPARIGQRAAAIGVGVVMVGYLAVTCIRIHPFYLDYYGEQVGGPKTVARKRWFEIAWWGEGVTQAIDYLNAHAAPHARVDKHCVLPSHLTWMRADLWANEVRNPRRADWIVIYQPARHRCPVPPDAKLVYQVSVEGAPLARVYRRPR